MELQARIKRIYSAIEDIAEIDFSELTPTVIKSNGYGIISQDFRGGLTDEQISNLAHSSIHNIANLKDHLIRWARQTGHDRDKVDEAIRTSHELQVIIDLSNVDKHGYPPRDGGYSGKSPRLRDIERVMQISSGSQPNSSAAVVFTPTPVAQTTGSGFVQVIITGTIVDNNGQVLGDLYTFLEKAMTAWEHLLKNYGLS